mmetsp:Transcript_13312/g.40264  ORF Transcript_13312/g.40264 Transcript_13312/m.40264 type:complete len:217 (-) Transcript_13312:469-1119(-)
MQLAHARDDGLRVLFVVLRPEGRVFGREPGQRFAHLVLVFLRLGFDGDRNDGLREVHLLQNHGVVAVAERLSGRRAFQAGDGDDVAGARRLDFRTVVRVHLEHAADSFFVALHRIEDLLARFQSARIHAAERQRANERVGHDLEGQGTEGLVVGGDAFNLRFAVQRGALDGLDVDGCRHVVHERVQQRLDAFVLEGRPAEHGNERRRKSARANAPL